MYILAGRPTAPTVKCLHVDGVSCEGQQVADLEPVRRLSRSLDNVEKRRGVVVAFVADIVAQDDTVLRLNQRSLQNHRLTINIRGMSLTKTM